MTVIDAEMPKALCCPETHQSLALADARLLARLNERIAAGQVRNRAGQPVTEPVDGGLVRSDGQFLYPVRRNLPVMLIDEAIPLAAGA